MTANSKLVDLIALAQEPSSARRRELLREVTDMFFTGADMGQPKQMALFDEVMTQLTGEMEVAVRAELAGRMADSPNAPRNLLRALANDNIQVAAPILTRSRLMTEEALIELAKTRDQGHLTAISRRAHVPESLSEVIVERGDDSTLDVLLRNEGAVLSRAAHEVAVDRATANPKLHEAVVQRQALPADLLNEMYFVVESKLRDKIMERNANMDPSALNAALEAGRNRVATRDGALPPDFAAAEKAVKALRGASGINPSALAAMMRNGEMTKFLIALGAEADIDFHTARRIIDRRELDALAIVCKAAGFDRALFLTIAVLVLGQEGDAMARAGEYGKLYIDLSKDVANRTIRFWRMRRTTGDLAA